MRIAFVTETWKPSINGVVTRIASSIDELVAAGHEVLIIAPSLGAADAAVPRQAGVTLHRIPAFHISWVYGGQPWGWPLPRVRRLLAEFTPDIVHVVSPFVLGIAGVRGARRLGLPLVVSFHTDIAAYAGSYHLAWARPIIWRILRALHNAGRLNLVTSQHSAALLTKHGVRNIALWRRGVDLERFRPSVAGRADAGAGAGSAGAGGATAGAGLAGGRPAAGTTPEPAGPAAGAAQGQAGTQGPAEAGAAGGSGVADSSRTADDTHPAEGSGVVSGTSVASGTSGRADARPTALYVGRLADEKRISSLLPLARSGTVRLVLVGDGPDRARLEQEFAGTDTVFTGSLTGEDLTRAYAEADVFVFTSTTETLGLVLIEALACGLPIVAVESPASRELLGALEVARLIAADRPGDFGAAVESLLSWRTPEARAALARAEAVGWGWAAATEELLDYYRGALGAASPRPAPARP
ncbi:MAG TPA: glycosyltransferase [Gryllotalpicola sp.]